MGIGAHQDDLEIMAIDGILKCFQRKDRVVCRSRGHQRQRVAEGRPVQRLHR
jgi:hypothetical protein